MLPGIEGQEARQEDIVAPHHVYILFPLHTLIDPAQNVPFGEKPFARNPYVGDTPPLLDELVHLFLIEAEEIGQLLGGEQLFHS